MRPGSSIGWIELFVVITVSATSLIGCSREETPAAAGEVATAAALVAPAPARTRIAVRPPGTATDQPPTVVLDTRSPELLGARGGPVLPEDFDIGPLQSGVFGRREVLAAAEVAGRFLDALSRGEVATEVVVEQRRSALVRSLIPQLEDLPTVRSYRVGQLETADGTAAGNVRLSSAVGVAMGEIYLIGGPDAWLVDDLQIDLAQLGRPTAETEELFLPNSYRWLLF